MVDFSQMSNEELMRLAGEGPNPSPALEPQPTEAIVRKTSGIHLSPQQRGIGQTAVDFFQKVGWTPEQSRGIASSIFRESSFNPTAWGDKDKKTGKYQSFGLGQWNGPRRKELFDLAASNGESIPSVMTQLKFMDMELNGQASGGEYKKAGDILRTTTNERDAHDAHMIHYERPAVAVRGVSKLIGNELGGPLDQSGVATGYAGEPLGVSSTQPGGMVSNPNTPLMATLLQLIQDKQEQPTIQALQPSQPEQPEPPSITSKILSMLGPSEAAAAEIPQQPGREQQPNVVQGEPDFSSMSNEQLEKLAKGDTSALADLSDSELVRMANQGEQKTPKQALDEMIKKMTGPERFLAGLGFGMADMYQGIKQAGALAGTQLHLNADERLVSPDTLKQITREGMAARQEMAPLLDQSWAAKAGEVVGQSAPLAVLPGGVAGGFLKRTGTAALAGATQGGLSFVPEGDSRVNDVILGALGGGAGSLTTAAAGKLINSLAGKVPDSLIKTLSEKWGIPVTKSELSTGAASRGDIFLERSPSFLGTQAFRARQQQAANDAAKSLLGQYIIDPMAPDIMQANRGFVSGLYNSVRALVDQIPNQEIMPTQTKRVATELLDRYPDIFKKLQDTKTEGLLRDVATGVKDIPGSTSTSPLVSATGQPIVTTTPPIPKTLTFDEAWTLRQGLGDLIGQARILKSKGEINDTAYSQFKKTFGAISDDMDAWASSIGRPDISAAFKGANTAYKQYVVKYDVLSRAYDKTVRELGDQEVFSPAKFSNNLNRIVQKDQYLKTFSESELKEMAGLANILQVAKRAGQFMENPPTGNRFGPIGIVMGIEGAALATGGAERGIKTAGALAGISLIGKFLTTTPMGKALALSASKIEPTSPAMAKIVNQIYQQMPKWAAQTGVDLDIRNPITSLK